MDRRVTRILVLGFTCLWFGVLVPVHQRGAIRLPGPAAVAAAGPTSPTHCGRAEAGLPCHRAPADPGSSPDAPADGGGGCAVCHFIAGLDVPLPVTTGIEPLGLLASLPTALAPAAPARHVALPYHGLDPPAA